MTFSTLLTRPITPILGLCVVLFSVGIISSREASQTSVRTYPTPISSVRTMPVTQMIPTKASSISTSTRYSVPANIRGDSEGRFGDD